MLNYNLTRRSKQKTEPPCRSCLSSMKRDSKWFCKLQSSGWLDIHYVSITTDRNLEGFFSYTLTLDVCFLTCVKQWYQTIKHGKADLWGWIPCTVVQNTSHSWKCLTGVASNPSLGILWHVQLLLCMCSKPRTSWRWSGEKTRCAVPCLVHRAHRTNSQST